MISRNEPCWCGSGKKWKHCHFPKEGTIHVPSTEDIKSQYFRKYHIRLKTEEEIEGIRRACKLTSEILDKTCAMAKEGVTTQELNDYAHQLHLEAGATPAPFHYGEPPFPKSICTSINEVICHGIPGPTTLSEGDIVNIDLSCLLNGYYGDCSRMVTIGTVSPERQLVVDVSYECLMKAIEKLKPGVPLSIIGETIESHADKRGCSVVYQFVAHGVGIEFHEGPQIPHHRNSNNIILVPGMTFTIEPMINAGVADAVIDRQDKWTARTRDGKASGQWEHTVLITDTGHEILTTWKR
ncbi:MAG: methionyl aminopeptidase [Parachlamydiaceae bacterium]